MHGYEQQLCHTAASPDNGGCRDQIIAFSFAKSYIDTESIFDIWGVCD
jgi:hypothetical protein